MNYIRNWLAKRQETNRQALGVGVVGGLLTWAILLIGGELLEVADVIDFGGRIPVWVAAVVAGVGLSLGLALARHAQARAASLRDEAAELREHTRIYDTYAEHIRDALADLRKGLAGELPALSLRDFVEGGLFEPAQRLLTRGGNRGEVRFSVLHVDREDFVMANADGLFPALGHSPEGRQRFRLPIDESFSMHAFRQRRVFASGKLSEDERFRPHPDARRPYESIVSVPIWMDGDVDGVFNVVATKAHACSAIDRTYIILLGSVLDVVRAARRSAETSARKADRDLPPG